MLNTEKNSTNFPGRKIFKRILRKNLQFLLEILAKQNHMDYINIMHAALEVEIEAKWIKSLFFVIYFYWFHLMKNIGNLIFWKVRIFLIKERETLTQLRFQLEFFLYPSPNPFPSLPEKYNYFHEMDILHLILEFFSLNMYIAINTIVVF